MKRRRLYWTLQLAGWFAWALNEALLYTNQYGWKWVWLFSSLANIALAIFLTHQYRRITLRYRWQDMNIWRMVQYNFLALVIMAVILMALNIPLDFLFLQENYEVSLSPFIIVQIFFNFVKPLAIWTLIYFFFQYSNKRLEMERENDQLERAILETEGKVLRAQMNPHFVFNALNSVRALITEDPVKAKKGINQLSKLLRSSLLTERKKTISLSEELDTILDYLSLEKIRYEDRLEWKITIDKICQKAQIPPMLLQTLVENGIKHGISHSVKGGCIEISAEIVNSFIKISVINPGHLKISKDISTGLGLVNSQNRLQLIYGKTAQIELQPLNKNQVCAKVTLPYLEEI
ncbi:sensor histidine kinase [Aquirufa sp.]|uniref:sensor histidine kinase n=1 Tax=Aquirufa sp. TaxID=2676249 RepID=UPI0037C00B72